MEKETDWYLHWFNEDYLKLYAYRNQKEAEHQVDFLFKALHLKKGMHLLDFGCGAGRHSYAFAKRGLHVIGIDTSSVLINEAIRLFHTEPLNVHLKFLQEDIRHFRSHQKFDVITSLFTSFGYFDQDEHNQEVLNKIHDELKFNGQFILDYLHPHQVKKCLIPYEEKTINNEKVIIEKRIDNDCVIKTIIFPKKTYLEKVKLYNRDVLEDMLIKSGLEIVEVWNDYEGNSWLPEGERQIFHCRKSSSR